VASAQAVQTHCKPRKVFIKVHISDGEHFGFNNEAARAEVDALNCFRRDDLLRLHIPRLLKTVWLEPEEAVRAVPQATRHTFPSVKGHALLLEFDARAGKTVMQLVKEVCPVATIYGLAVVSAHQQP
jgi:hypothetical protein